VARPELLIHGEQADKHAGRVVCTRLRPERRVMRRAGLFIGDLPLAALILPEQP